jgi:hypothetical protein
MWKLGVILSVSLIVLIVLYFNMNRKIDYKEKIEEISLKPGKIKMKIQKEEEMNKIIIPDEHIVYYFHSECPGYKEDILIVEKNHIDNEEIENYYLPEEGHAIIVKKNHVWSKEPNFKFWKLEKEKENVKY